MGASVIIPAYNEEDRLPRLLDDLSRQRGARPQVILADAHSTDATRELAVARGATVVDGGMPAAGRNAGAAHATGEILVFLDADVRVPRTFLRNALREMADKDAVVATCVAKPMSRLTADRLIHTVANLFIRINQDRDPHAPGYCILARRDVFNAVGGFNEEIQVAEDHDFVSRASTHGRFRLLDSTHVKVDVRRFEKEGRIGYTAKALKITLYRALYGEITDPDAFEYEFGNYDAEDSTTADRALRRLERGLIRAERRTRRLEDQLWRTSEARGMNERAQEFFAEIGEKLRAACRTVLRPESPGTRGSDER
jgi:glycosyltransferase involved in cell wall biosynthesis